MDMLEWITKARRMVLDLRDEGSYMSRRLEMVDVEPKKMAAVKAMNQDLLDAYTALMLAEANYMRTI